MIQYITILVFLLGTTINCIAQKPVLETLGITNGSIHMKGSFPYTKFVKKYKGENDLAIHVYYNSTGSTLSKKEIKAGADEVYFLYGSNLNSGLTEMDFKLGASALQVFSKKKEAELIELVDFLQFEVFANQHFNGDIALEALKKALE